MDEMESKGLEEEYKSIQSTLMLIRKRHRDGNGKSLHLGSEMKDCVEGINRINLKLIQIIY